MSRFDFRSLERPWLQPPLDDSAHMVARWVLAHHGSEALARAAAWARWAEAQGDSCLPLDGGRADAPRWSEAEIASLRGESSVGDGSAQSPFVIDAAQRLYFWRNWRHEQVVAECILARLQRIAEQPAAPDDLIAALIDPLFADTQAGPSERQRAAVRASLDQRLLILTGGPGTGKTSTVLRLLLAQHQLSAMRGKDLRIRLAAPTGKASQRLGQALRQVAESLAPLLPEAARAGLQTVLGSSPETVHRLLGYRPDQDRFSAHRGQPVDADLVVVDEASMLDLATLRCLLDAVPAQALLVLVGDAEQLTSVAAGSALDDIVRALEARGSEHVIRLQHGFRSEQSLQAAIEAARYGDLAGLQAAIAASAGDIEQRPLPSSVELARRLQDWAIDLAELLSPLRELRGEAAAGAALAAWQRNQLLCALRQGPLGALQCAELIESALRKHWAVLESNHWFAGRSVLIRSNDYARGLYNGDLGVVMADEQGQLRVWFQSAGDAAGLRSFAPADLPPHDSAAAITVHKSQGSEYERIAILLPADCDSPILSRQLLYTALSRARRRIELWSSTPALQAALGRRIERIGGLFERLQADGSAVTR